MFSLRFFKLSVFLAIFCPPLFFTQSTAMIYGGVFCLRFPVIGIEQRLLKHALSAVITSCPQQKS